MGTVFVGDLDKWEFPIGRPSTSTDPHHVKLGNNLGRANRRLIVREMAEEVNSDRHFGLTRVASKFVPRVLNRQQLLNRANGASEFLKTIVTGDETPRPKTARMPGAK
ncbi:hypothetical protein R5R35_004838 [Gryllus longicercus]|uniref:Uncharacterized protein n=1 Tax=Gryllus longicercus TaxID=2509291 RepID=A0AAN9VTC0_9ORTH